MSPRPDEETRTAAKARVTELKKLRDQAHADAEKAKQAADEAMWQAIAAELDQDQLLQRDVSEVTGFSRDHVLKRTKKHRTT